MGDVETNMVDAVYFHFLVDGAGHDVAGCEREPVVVFLHERLSVGQFQYAAIAAHGFGDEIGGMGLAGIVEHGGVELHKLHVLHGSLGTIDHGDAVAGGDDGVRSGLIDGSAASGTHHGDFGQIGIYFLGFGVEHVGTVAINIR